MSEEIVEVESWVEFKHRMEKCCSRRVGEHRSLPIFRGHSDASWFLETTLDRRIKDIDAKVNREIIAKELLGSFRRWALGFADEATRATKPIELQCLARHYGVPTIVLDWTYSYYVASYFAFFEHHPSSSSDVSVWMLERDADYDDTYDDAIVISDNPELLRYNPRAIEQQAVFMIVNDPEVRIGNFPGITLRQWIIPSCERSVVLLDLKRMGITARSMFRNLDGAAMTATWDVINNVENAYDYFE